MPLPAFMACGNLKTTGPAAQGFCFNTHRTEKEGKKRKEGKGFVPRPWELHGESRGCPG